MTAQLRALVQIWLVIALASILPVTCIVHCGLHDAPASTAHTLYVCDMGHGIVAPSTPTDVHATTRLPAFFELLSPIVALWFSMWLLVAVYGHHLHLRGCVVTPLVPPPQSAYHSTVACG